MKEINLFYTFGIVPYCYDTEERTFLYDKRDRFYSFLFKILLPSVALVVLAVLWPDVLFLGNSIMAYVFAMQVILNLSTLYLHIFANYRNVRFYKRFQQYCSISDTEAENSAYWNYVTRIALLVMFYAYYEVCLVIYTKVYDIRPFKELCFYLIYYYLELMLILNVFYVELLIRSLRQYLKQLYQMDRSIIKTTRQYFKYIRRKSELCHEIRFRMLYSAANTYLAASAMLYTMMRRMEMEETFSSWIAFNEMVFNLGSCSSQLIALAGLCREVQRCSMEEQELARKLSDLRENYTKSNRDSPSTTMTKISVLYRPPAISAYGLFEINLNFFYQMIAAIFTQCVILFQFQSFET